jgi:hypothetical protein
MLTPVSRAALMGSMAALALSGCSLGEEDEPKPIRGAPRQVVEAVQELDRAIRARDFDRICTRLFTAAARRRAGGRDCARLLRSTARGLRRPAVTVVGIELSGDRAEVRVSSRARGQPPLEDVIELVRRGRGYRIEALAR